MLMPYVVTDGAYNRAQAAKATCHCHHRIDEYLYFYLNKNRYVLVAVPVMIRSTRIVMSAMYSKYKYNTTCTIL
jgi:hypothetical protein